MISQEKADACLESESAKLKEMSYEALEEFARSHNLLDDWQSRELQVDGEKVWVSTTICKFGRIHKRISVEMVLGAEGEGPPAVTACLYFERFKSGRFYPSSREEAREAAMLKSLPYVLLGIVVIGLTIPLLNILVPPAAVIAATLYTEKIRKE